MPHLKQMVKRAKVEIAKARRTCKFTGESIAKGSACLVIHDGPRDRSCYSQNTALKMIRLARARLDELERELSEQIAIA